MFSQSVRRTAADDAVLVLGLRVSILRLVELLAHHVVQRAAPEVEDLLEGPPEVPVEGGVDDRVQEGVGVPQPEEETAKYTESLSHILQTIVLPLNQSENKIC